jgi:alpha-beta hydrolase superfamily lysophospholipase
MGSFMTQSRLERYPHSSDRTILIGSNGGQGALMSIASALSSMVVSAKKWDEPCPLLTNLGLGGYSKAIKDRKTDLDWLSYNEENVKAYIADPKTGHPNTGGFWLEFMRGMKDIWTKKALDNLSKDEDIFIIAGEEDPVGQNGKGPKWLYDTYKAHGIEKVELKLYKHMRHEIHNEDDYMTVYDDLANFILR